MNSLGIDVSKDTLDIALLDSATGEIITNKVPNSIEGHQALQAWLHDHDVFEVHVCMEATGTYGDQVARYLYAQGHSISMLNPIQAKRFSQMQLKRNNTDQVDAILLAKLCQVSDIKLWEPLTSELQELKELVNARKSYIRERTSYKNRLNAPSTSTAVKRSYEKHLEHLDQVIKELEQAIDDLIADNETLDEDISLIVSIPGISHITAASVVAEIGNIRRFDKCKHLVSFSGLAPGSKTSGTSVHHKLKMARFGKQSMRTLMYMPAISAKRHNPLIKPMVEKLEKAGKPTMVIIGAVMRKLMRLIYGVLKSRTPFDPNYRKNQSISI